MVMDALLYLFCAITAVLAVMLVVCILADYVAPHIGVIRRYIDSLPEYEDEEEI